MGQWNVSVHVNVANGNLRFSRIAISKRELAQNVFKNMQNVGCVRSASHVTVTAALPDRFLLAPAPGNQ